MLWMYGLLCGVPTKAIDIVIDEEGFEYPLINCEKCVGCGICLKVCPIKS